MDYVLPKVGDLPSFELRRTETPTPINPLGTKRAGEAEAMGAPTAIMDAVIA
jgi:carbon-monoxide dehydrogenase large subunit